MSISSQNVSSSFLDFFDVDFRISRLYDYRAFQGENEGCATLMNENRIYTHWII